MKKILAILLMVTLLAAGCAGATESPTKPPTTVPSETPKPTPAPTSARILYVVDEEGPNYTLSWPIHLEARGFQVHTVIVNNSLVDANIAGYDLVVIGYVLNSRINVPIYISISKSDLPVIIGDQNLVQLFALGIDTFQGRTIYGDFIHIASDHTLTKGYTGDVVCAQSSMYCNIIEADGIVLATATTQEKDRSPTPPDGLTPPPELPTTGAVWSVKGNRIYFGAWANITSNADYWTFFDRSTDYLLGLPSVKAPSEKPAEQGIPPKAEQVTVVEKIPTKEIGQLSELKRIYLTKVYRRKI